ncbi:MAG TPA: sugar kinase [Acidothermaceae bacterium]
MTTAPVELVTFGETMGVLGTDELGPLRNGHRMVLGIAGAESNVAIGVRRLGHSVAWTGRVGADPIGRLVVRELRAEGVDVSHATTDADAPTGFMLKVRRTTATSEVIYARKDSAGSRLQRSDLATDLIAAARVLHITGITMALSDSARDCVLAALDVARSHNVRICLDINHRNALWTDDAARSALLDVASRCDFMFASEHEAALLVGALSPTDAARAMADLGPQHAIIKRGDLGYVASIDGQLHSGAALSVPVADPVGAGDAFVAGYLASWLDGAPTADALRTANCAGAFVVAVSGDWEGLPTRAELDAFGAGGDPVAR